MKETAQCLGETIRGLPQPTHFQGSLFNSSLEKEERQHCKPTKSEHTAQEEDRKQSLKRMENKLKGFPSSQRTETFFSNADLSLLHPLATAKYLLMKNLTHDLNTVPVLSKKLLSSCIKTQHQGRIEK